MARARGACPQSDSLQLFSRLDVFGRHVLRIVRQHRVDALLLLEEVRRVLQREGRAARCTAAQPLLRRLLLRRRIAYSASDPGTSAGVPPIVFAIAAACCDCALHLDGSLRYC